MARGKAGSELERTQGWSRSDGYYTLRRWNGTKNFIQGLQASVALGADNYEITNEGPLYFLTARYSKIAGVGDAVAEVASELWELDGEDFTKSIYANAGPVALEAVYKTVNASTGQGLWIKVQGMIDERKTWDQAVALGLAVDSFSIAGLTAPQIAAIKAIYNLVESGTDSFRASAYVLRRSRRASPAYAFGVETNVNKMATRAQLLGWYSTIPAFISGRMPATGYWLKGTPTTRQAADNKYEDVVTWTHADDYSTYLYELAT